MVAGTTPPTRSDVALTFLRWAHHDRVCQVQLEAGRTDCTCGLDQAIVRHCEPPNTKRRVKGTTPPQ